jgi:hypothetical protein
MSGQFSINDTMLLYFNAYILMYNKNTDLAAMAQCSKLNEELIIKIAMKCKGKILGDQYSLKEKIEFKNLTDAKQCIDQLNAELLMSKLTIKE